MFRRYQKLCWDPGPGRNLQELFVFQKALRIDMYELYSFIVVSEITGEMFEDNRRTWAKS